MHANLSKKRIIIVNVIEMYTFGTYSILVFSLPSYKLLEVPVRRPWSFLFTSFLSPDGRARLRPIDRPASLPSAKSRQIIFFA